MKILIYIMPLLLIVYLICITVDISKRNKGMKEAEIAGGVSFRHKYPEFVKALWMSILGILLLVTGVFMGLYRRDVAEWTLKNIEMISSCGTLMGFYVIGLIDWLVVYFKYNEFRLCDNCFYLSGHKYDCKKYRYTLEDNAVIFSAKHMVEMRITVPEDKRKEVLGILEKYYTKEV